MLEHNDWDDTSSEPVKEDIKLPEKVDSIEVSHDGGRLTISVNGEDLYYTASGTRDCSVSIDRKELS